MPFNKKKCGNVKNVHLILCFEENNPPDWNFWKFAFFVSNCLCKYRVCQRPYLEISLDQLGYEFICILNKLPLSQTGYHFSRVPGFNNCLFKVGMLCA